MASIFSRLELSRMTSVRILRGAEILCSHLAILFGTVPVSKLKCIHLYCCTLYNIFLFLSVLAPSLPATSSPPSSLSSAPSPASTTRSSPVAISRRMNLKSEHEHLVWSTWSLDCFGALGVRQMRPNHGPGPTPSAPKQWKSHVHVESWNPVSTRSPVTKTKKWKI